MNNDLNFKSLNVRSKKNEIAEIADKWTISLCIRSKLFKDHENTFRRHGKTSQRH